MPTQIPALTSLSFAFYLVSVPAKALEINESNLWYGEDDGIEIVFRTGENPAFTGDDPSVDPTMTKFVGGWIRRF